MNNYDGLRTLLYFAYGALLKGICNKDKDFNKNFTKKVRRYLVGELSLKDSILDEIYLGIPNAYRNLNLLAGEDKSNTFSKDNVEKYVFKLHSENEGPMPPMYSCAVMSGKVKGIDHKKRTLKVSREGETLKISFLSSLEKSFKIGDEVYFHHGWLIKK
jgi:hypothetical protein